MTDTTTPLREVIATAVEHPTKGLAFHRQKALDRADDILEALASAGLPIKALEKMRADIASAERKAAADAEVEKRAKDIYDAWSDHPGWTPWHDGRKIDMQSAAQGIAHTKWAYETARAAQGSGGGTMSDDVELSERYERMVQRLSADPDASLSEALCHARAALSATGETRG